MKKLVVRAAAAADIEDAYRWYERRQPGLGEDFIREVGDALRKVADSPLRYPALHRNTRRVLLHRFPYALWYRVIQEVVAVVACLHGNRDPRIARGR